NAPVTVDVRIIAASNRDLDAAVAEGKFRRDLFHRLKVATIRLPTLRERKDDIPQLGAHFLKELAKKYGKPVPRVSTAVWKAFENHDWPGNVRELKNLLENMLLLDLDGELTLDDLPEDSGVRPHGIPGGATAATGPDHLIGRPLEDVE